MHAVSATLAPRRLSATTFAALLFLLAFGAAALLLPHGAWFGAAGVSVLGIGLAVAAARRSGAADLPQVRHLPGE